MGMPAIGEPRWRAAVCHVVRLLPATFACEVSVSIDWALLSVYSSMSQTHRDDAGIVECGDELDCCASLQQSAEELAPTQLCASRGIWCVNCEDGVGASDQLLRIVDARADVGVRPRREQSTRTRVAFHQNIDSTGRCTLAGITATGVSPGAVLEGVDCDRQYRRAPQLSLCSAWPCDTFASGCSLPAALHVFNARKVAVKPQGSE